jgi:FkbM family methyltransferase
MLKFLAVTTAALLRASHRDIDVGNSTSEKAECALPVGARWCSLYTGEGAGQKIRIACHTTPPSPQCEQICTMGNWEDLSGKLHKLSHSSVPKGSNVLDIGANIGAYSLMAAYYGFTVHAFEPMDKNLELFRASLCANSHLLDESRVTIHQSLVGDQEGSCSLYEARQGLGVMCCGQQECAQVEKHNKFVKTMPILRLDSVLGTEIKGHIAYVKMDVEGAECKVLNGGTKLLEEPFHPDMIQSEVMPRGMGRDDGCTAQGYLDRYANAGSCVHRKWFQCREPNHRALMGGVSDYYMLSKTYKGYI